MKLYGHPMSTCTRKVMTTLAEKNAEAQFVLVDLMKAEQKTPEHLARQPFGVIPVLEDDGFSLYESRAIIRYLDAKLPGTSLTPADLKARARMDQWISVEQSYYASHVVTLLYQLMFNPMGGKPTDQDVVKKTRETLSNTLDIVAKNLSSNQYLAGDAYSLADICFMPYTDYLFTLKQGDLVTDRPAVAAWWERVSSRPAWKKATAKLAWTSVAPRRRVWNGGEAGGRQFQIVALLNC